MMIDLVFDYMAAKGVVFYSQEEMKTAEAGIREYLQCSGIPEEKNDEYYRDYLHRGLFAFIRKATTGYAGGHKEFHLWMEKENLR